MARHTSKSLRNQVMYQVFVRNYSEEGTFEGVRRDLDRIQDLGVDIIYLMPIHPIGEVARKGAQGSPYAIRDYRAINPEFGTLEDFQRLVDDIHARGMKVIMDVVYNHTSPDSVLAKEHPEWFYHKPDGSFGNRCGEWADIIDLDFDQKDLWDYLAQTMAMWAKYVDGFRCDVAPLLPIEFWEHAMDTVAEVNGDCLWLSESVEWNFLVSNRAKGLVNLSDCEIFGAFDVAYEYDVYWLLKGYLAGQNSLEKYAEFVTLQEALYPDNYVKLRFLENHDNTRAHYLVPDETMLRNWTAFLYFQKGMTFVYAGQEVGCSHLPSLIDRDPGCWDVEVELRGDMKRLYQLKKNPLLTDSSYDVQAQQHDILVANHRKGDRALTGVFSVRGEKALVVIDAPDGVYENLYDGSRVEVLRNRVPCVGKPIIIEWQAE